MLKDEIHNYITNKGDIGYARDFDSVDGVDEIIKQIFDKYKIMSAKMDESEYYLDYITNDLLGIIGYRNELVKNNDTEGVKIWDKIQKITHKKNLNEQKLIKLFVVFFGLRNFFRSRA